MRFLQKRAYVCVLFFLGWVCNKNDIAKKGVVAVRIVNMENENHGAKKVVAAVRIVSMGNKNLTMIRV